MRRRIPLVMGALVAIVGLSLSGVWAVRAQEYRTGDTVEVMAGTVDGTLYVAGRSVTIDADVNGDIYCAGQTVVVNGAVSGDVICAGQSVTVKGNVDGDVRVAGQVVTVDSNVSGSLSAFGQAVSLSTQSTIGRDATVAGNDVTLAGTVSRDVTAGGEAIVLSGAVGRDMTTEVNRLTLHSQASVGGDVNYTSKNTLVRDSGSTIGGEVVRRDPPVRSEDRPENKVVGYIGSAIYWLFAWSALVLAAVLVFPRALHGMTNRAFPAPWRALLVGFVTTIVVPVALVFVALTWIGLPLAGVLAVTWLTILLLSGVVFAYYIGRILLRGQRNQLLVALVGAMVVAMAYHVPILNMVTLLAILWLGSGMILLDIFDHTPRPQYQQLDKPMVKLAKKA